MEKKYLTKVTEEQRDWIRMAAQELEEVVPGITHPKIVQMALDRFMEHDWEKVKKEIVTKEAKKTLEMIEAKIQELRKQKEDLQGRENYELVN